MERDDEDTLVRGRLDRLVPRLVLDWVTDEPDRRWRIVEGTVVFADISGFTALSERLATRGRIGTEELVETLSRVFSGMLGITATRGGQLLKFGGDALLLLFTGPDHARQAASAAVEIRQDLRRSAQIPTSVGKLRLAISIGVHSGSFHLFLVGEPYRQLVVAGPDTTTTMNAETAAEAGQIVVTAATAALLGPDATMPREDGQLLLRWRKGMVPRIAAAPARVTDSEAARHVTPPIIAALLEHGSPDPVHRVATMAFFKFKGTDQRLESDGPEAFAEALHVTLTRALETFEAEDIALLYVDVDANGGKLFCSSGVPRTSEDDEGRMLRAARAILDGGTPLPLQVGIHRGHVFAGELGAADQAVFSIMGDTVNTAARIMVTAGPGVIHAHPAVLEHARTLYNTNPEGPFVFKGKAQPQVVYRVDEELGPRRAATRDALRLLGRDEEFAALRNHIEAVTEGRGGVVTVVGAAGLGKSRLVDEALSATTGERTLIKMHAEPYGASHSYRVVRDPLRVLVGLGTGDSTTLAERLVERVHERAPHLQPFLPLIADALQLDVAMTPAVESIAPSYRADRTADVVIEFIRAVHTGPLVVTAEDMHWSDAASAHLLGRMAAATQTNPWLLMSVRREEDGGFDTELGDRIAIGPLSDRIVRQLTIEATEAAPLRPHEIDLVVSRAAGSPLFVGELIAAAQELGSLDAVPASLQGTLAAQVDALDPLSRRVLSYASVLGRSFRRVVVEELLRQEGLELDSATIAQLGRFLEADGPLRYRFKNGLVCDVVYDGLAFRSRARLHLEAGMAFEKLSSDVALDAAMLSLHFWNAGDHERTYRYARMAAERADRAYTAAEAAVHYERAVDAARRVALVSIDERRLLLVALGDARQHAGMFDAALDAYHRAVALARNDVLASAEIHLRRARVRELSGAFPLALRETSLGRRIASAVASAESEAVQARALAYAAVIRGHQERSVEAWRDGMAAIEMAERCGEHSALARANHAIFLAGRWRSHDDTASYAQRALHLYAEVGDLAGQADMANNLGIIAYYDGRWDDTLDRYRQAVDADVKMGNLLGAAITEANIGEVLVNQGHLDEAEPRLRDAARVLRASHSFAAGFVEMHLGRLLTARGEYEAAERILRSGVEELRAMGRGATAYEMALHLADCLARSDRPQEALQVIADASRGTSDSLAIFDAARAVVSARALIELGFTNEAIETIVEGVETARAQNLEFDLARLLLLADRIGPPFDQRLGTTEPIEEARRLFDRLGVVSTVSA